MFGLGLIGLETIGDTRKDGVFIISILNDSRDENESNKKKAINTVAAINNVLQDIPVKGSKHTSIMTGVFSALNQLEEWLKTLEIEVGDSPDDGKHN